MNTERLRHLITVLEVVPAKQFDLDDWKAEHDCGTTACAIGWAGMDAKFNAEGFHLSMAEHCSYEPMYNQSRNWSAVQEFFGLNWGDANHLFYPSTYPYSPRPTPADVIVRIKNLIGE